MKLLLTVPITSACLLLATQTPLADTISGEIHFSSKPPLVALIYIPSASPSGLPADIDQIDKAFTKKLIVVSQGSSVNFKNSDSVDHNVFVNDLKHGAQFDVGLMAPGGNKHIKVDWSENSIVRVGCKIHPRMRTYLANIKTRHYTIVEFDKTKQRYQFEISDIPDDAGSVVVKIPKYDVIKLDIERKGSSKAPIVKRGKQRGEFFVNRIAG